MNVRFVDGLREQLKQQQALPETDQNPINTLLQDKSLSGPEIGKLIHQLHEHRPLVKNGLDEDVPSAEKSTKMLYDATENRLTVSLVGRKPLENGTYDTYARITLERPPKGKWDVTSFFTSLDPTGFDPAEAKQYVDLTDGIKGAYKGNEGFYAAAVMQQLTKGEDLWGALSRADHMGRIDDMFSKARKQEQARLDAGEKPQSIMRVKDGRIPGTTDWASGVAASEKRVSMFPIAAMKAGK
jgi:hypothetical protein